MSGCTAVDLLVLAEGECLGIAPDIHLLTGPVMGSMDIGLDWKVFVIALRLSLDRCRLAQAYVIAVGKHTCMAAERGSTTLGTAL